MNDCTRVKRRARLAPARTATAIITISAAVALLAAACSPPTFTRSPRAAASANSPSALAYSVCMRSKGVPNFPDPGSSGQVPKGDAQQFGVSTRQYQASQQACRHLLPTGGSLQQQAGQCMQNNDCSPALVAQMLTADRKLAQCMRSHGVPNFPDPTNGGPGGPFFDISSVGISEAASRTPQFVNKLNECARLTGDSAPESFG